MESDDMLRRVLDISLEEHKIEGLYERGIFFVPGAIDTNLSMNLFLGMTTNKLPKNKPLWFVIDSGGGDLTQGLAIYDIIKMAIKSGRTVNTLGLGLVASMATCVLQAGSRRYAFPMTQFCVHQASVEQGDEHVDAAKLMDNAKDLERLNRIALGIVSERSGKPLKDLLKISDKKDAWFNTKEALKLGPRGLIDEVIVNPGFLINGT